MSVVWHSLLTAGVPALVAGIVWLLGGRIPPLARFQGVLYPLAFGVSFCLACWLTVGRPAFPPTDAMHWLFYFALMGILLGWLAEIPADYRWLWGALALLLLGGWMVLALKPLIQSGYWTPVSGVRIILVLTVATWLLAVLVAPNGEQERGAGLPFLLATLGGLSAGLIFYNKSASLGQLAGSLGAIVGVGVPIGWLLRDFRLRRGVVSVALMVLALLWALAYGYAELPARYLALLYLSGASLALSRLKPLARLNPIALFALRLLLLLILAGIPLLLSYQTYMAGQEEYPYY